MYESIAVYNAFFNTTKTDEDQYTRNESIAVLYLKKHCSAFPTVDQYNLLADEYKENIKLAILYQTNHVYDNEDHFLSTPTTEVKSFSLGRFSVSEKSQSLAVGDYSELALEYLKSSGLCGRTLNLGGCGC